MRRRIANVKYFINISHILPQPASEVIFNPSVLWGGLSGLPANQCQKSQAGKACATFALVCFRLQLKDYGDIIAIVSHSFIPPKEGPR
jgi:hypothetical protein